MNAIQLPLHPDLAPAPLPAKHYTWFQLANSHPSNHWKKHWWFPFKEKFLARYAVRDGYDLQIIEHSCYACDGMGCHRCEDGIYSRHEIPLQRWLFPNGDLYHKPAPYLPAGRPACYHSQIKGLIKHADITERTAILAALRLFFRYDRGRFIDLVRATYGDRYWLGQLKAKTSRIYWKIYCKRIALHNRFFPPQDEIPF
jgi:hypothetical protein